MGVSLFVAQPWTTLNQVTVLTTVIPTWADMDNRLCLIRPDPAVDLRVGWASAGDHSCSRACRTCRTREGGGQEQHPM